MNINLYIQIIVIVKVVSSKRGQKFLFYNDKDAIIYFAIFLNQDGLLHP